MATTRRERRSHEAPARELGQARSDLRSVTTRQEPVARRHSSRTVRFHCRARSSSSAIPAPSEHHACYSLLGVISDKRAVSSGEGPPLRCCVAYPAVVGELTQTPSATAAVAIAALAASVGFLIWLKLHRHAEHRLRGISFATGAPPRCPRCGGNRWDHKRLPWPRRTECALCGFPRKIRRRGAW